MKTSGLSGKRVKLVRMEDPYTNLKRGDIGTIEGEDDLGHIYVIWDNNSRLSLIPEVDEFEILEENKKYLKTFKNF